MENIMVAAVYLSDKYTYTIKKNSNIVGSFRKKKKCYYFTAKRYSLWNKFTEFSSVDLQKKKKKEKNEFLYFFLVLNKP